MNISHHRVYCDTESTWKDWYLPSAEAPPTKCPTDTAHDIDALKTKTIGQTYVSGAQDEEGNALVALVPNLATGLTSVSPLSIPESALDIDQSWQCKAAPLVTDITDIRINGGLTGPLGINYLQGGQYRVRTDAAEGSVLHLLVVDRDDIASPGLFAALGIPFTKLDVTGLTGDLSTATYAVGQTSGAKSGVLSYVVADVKITFGSGFSGGYPVPWEDGEAVKFFDASDVEVAAGTSVDWIEGGFFVVAEPVKDNWIEGVETRQIRPGGAKVVPGGLYYRILTYNAHMTDDLRVVVSLSMATE